MAVESGICPYCKKSFKMFSEDYITKHIARCARLESRYQYKDRKPGRPPTKSTKLKDGDQGYKQ